MEFGFIDFLTLVGSLGVFLYGMKLMSESLQKVAGQKMRSILSAMTSNRFLGVFTGFLITAVIQSSSATTVMIVSFVNAGLLSLSESIGVIMGANIGTTVTAWIISILGFKVKMSAIAIPLIGIAFPLFFSKKSKRKSIGELIIGFSLLFIGLGYLKAAVPDIKGSHQALEFLSSYTDMGYISLLIFIFIGTLLTVIIQSSSATMALTLVLAANGIISFDIAAAMVLGENIGTTITANLASIVANVSAKRAARAHFIFNVFGVIWILILFFPVLNLISWFMLKESGQSPFDNVLAIPIALSIFHTFFNITNVLIMIWFIPLIKKIVVKLVPNKDDEEEYRLKHINIGLLSTSEMSLLQAKKEIEVFGERAQRMFGYVKELYHAKKEKEITKFFEKVQKYEDILDRMEVEIAEYLTKISESELSKLGSRRITMMLDIIDAIESAGDTCMNLAKTIMYRNENKIKLTPELKENMEKMFELVDSAIETMNQNLSGEYYDANVEKAFTLEKKINEYRNILRTEHLINVKVKKYKYRVGVLYSELFSNSEKLGDHIINVSEAIHKA